MIRSNVITLIFFLASVHCHAKNIGLIIPIHNTVTVKKYSEKKMMAIPLAKMKVKDFEKLTGKKLTLKEKLGFKILQFKYKKEIRKNEKEKYSKRSKAAFILSILSLATVILIPLSVILAVISIILASKSLKENDMDRKAKTALGLSILALGIIVVGLLIYGIFVSDGAFKLFIIS